MITLYHAPQSRSVRPRWLLEEIGTDYKVVTLDMSKQEHKSEAHLRVHPLGQVPALTDDGLTLIESAAICLYLADTFPAAKLSPAVVTPERGRYDQWIMYAVATLEPPVLQVLMNTVMLPEAERSAAQATAGREKFKEVAKVITDGIGTGPYLLGDQFSAADVMIGSTLAWASFMGLLDGQPTLATYVERLVQRPAYQRMQAA